METRRLLLLVELSRLGSMREVAEELATTTSAVSQQLAALAREVGVPLLEPDGRRVRLTPAGRRLAEHSVAVLAAVEAARSALDPEAEPHGTVRVAGFATAVRRSLMPIVATLADEHPDVELVIREHEPPEALALLGADDVDVALTYDYDLAPSTRDARQPPTDRVQLWSAEWGVGMPTDRAPAGRTDLGWIREDRWIVNSRHSADEQVVRVLASAAGFEPRVRHRADSLDLVQDLVAAGQGVALLPLDQPVRDGVSLVPLAAPVRLRAYAATAPGRATWPPLALVLRLLGE